MANKKQRRAMIGKMGTMTPEEAEKMSSLCAWGGCVAHFNDPMPSDWRSLVVYWQPRAEAHKLVKMLETGQDVQRDGVLCPEHVRALESLLKPLMREVSAPAQGSA